jgi:hypothetical protein
MSLLIGTKVQSLTTTLSLFNILKLYACVHTYIRLAGIVIKVSDEVVAAFCITGS